MVTSLQGHGVIVSGGSSGIGRAVALRLAGGGSQVVVIDVDTPLYRRSIQESFEHGADQNAVDAQLSHRTPPDEVAELLAFRASEVGSAVRGTAFAA